MERGSIDAGLLYRMKSRSQIAAKVVIAYRWDLIPNGLSGAHGKSGPWRSYVSLRDILPAGR